MEAISPDKIESEDASINPQAEQSSSTSKEEPVGLPTEKLSGLSKEKPAEPSTEIHSNTPEEKSIGNFTSTAADLTTISIKEALKTVGDKPDDNANEQKSAVNNDEGSRSENASFKEIDTSDFLKFWSEFAESLKEAEPRMFAALRNQEPVLSNGNTVSVYFRNNTQLDEFKNRIRPLLISFYKAKLDYTELNIEGNIFQDDKEPETKHLTEKDKLKHMTLKNPALQKLKQEFNLDFE